MYKLPFRYLVILLVAFILCHIFYIRANNHTSEFKYDPISQVNSTANDFSERPDKFIFPPNAGCVGLGNQMFRIAAVYGIGRSPNVNRIPAISEPKDCLVEYIKEFSGIFPNVVKLVKFIVSFIEHDF